MWFKNLVVFRLPSDWSLSPIELEEQLARRVLQPCGPLEMSSRGWVSPGPSGRLVHTVGVQQLIALGVDQKLLPASIIRQVAKERAEALPAEQGHPVSRRQMRELKLRVTEELRARALSRRRVTRAWIDPQGGWFVVDAAGAARAEEVVETLRATLGGFAAQPLETQRSPQSCMGTWLRAGDAPDRFRIDQDLELQAADRSRATIRYTRHPLDGKQIQAHLQAGLCATRLGLTWSDRISFVLTDKLHVKRVEFLDVRRESAADEEVDPSEQFDTEFALMAGELSRLLTDLAAALGGESRRPEAAAA
jgi:DNA recombination-dependent growth factor C